MSISPLTSVDTLGKYYNLINPRWQPQISRQTENCEYPSIGSSLNNCFGVPPMFSTCGGYNDEMLCDDILEFNPKTNLLSTLIDFHSDDPEYLNNRIHASAMIL